MATHKPFRELIKPGSNFEFIGGSRRWITISVVLVLASIAMLFVNKSVRGDYLNWTIDFKGGTEIVFAFDKKGTDEPVAIPSGDIRQALLSAGYPGTEVSGFSWNETRAGVEVTVPGMLIRTPSFGALEADEAVEIAEEFRTRFADRDIGSVQWSGDRLFVRAQKPVTEAEAKEFFAGFDKEMKDWGERAEQFSTPNQATGEYAMQFEIWGLERQFATALQESIPDVDVDLVNFYAVGARAGDELRNDGITALFYAMALILLYLAFRFDIRYAPGAVVALLHDAIVVVGVFAALWVEVSLTSVAALLTVIGYSVNDTVIIFDRIRENIDRLKDKKLVRIVNISLNETLARTLLTSLTLFVVTVMMNVLGTGLVANFAFAMNVGVVVGVYSSIFIASPVLLYLDNKYYGGKATARGRGGRPAAKAGDAK